MRGSGDRPRVVGAVAWVLLAAGVVGIGGCPKAAVAPEVTIHGKSWFVDLALTPEQHYQGLSGRTDLPGNVGMLFVFPDSAIREFCMRGCFIPLDIAFLDENRRVVHTATMAVEADRVGPVVYESQLPAKYALEVAAGALGAAGVKVGDQARFKGDIPR